MRNRDEEEVKFWNGISVGGKPSAGMPIMGGVRQYWQQVRALGPIRYWPLWDAAGSLTAIDLIAGDNGTLGLTTTAPTLGVAGIGDGRTACSFDGGDFVNIYSAALASAFSPAEGSMAIWAKVSAAGVWTDGATHYFFNLRADNSNRILIQKTTTNNQMFTYHIAGGTTDFVGSNTLAPTDWFHVAVTWSRAADEMKFFVNGSQYGSTATTLGVWAGSLAATSTIIGSQDTSPTQAWSGSLAHAALWTRALTPAEILKLATV